MKQQENRAEPQEKQIRFIDSHYNLKFYIPDGGKIKITFRDGHTADRVCKYIDDYHCMSEIAAIIYASLLKKWSLMEVKLNLSINPNRQKQDQKQRKTAIRRCKSNGTKI